MDRPSGLSQLEPRQHSNLIRAPVVPTWASPHSFPAHFSIVSREEWRGELGVTEEADELAAVGAQMAEGRLLGSRDFVAELGPKMRRVLEPRAVGRPRKRAESDAPSTVQSALSFALVQGSGNT